MNEAKVDLKTIYKELHLQSQYSPYADTTYLQLEKKNSKQIYTFYCQSIYMKIQCEIHECMVRNNE